MAKETNVRHRCPREKCKGVLPSRQGWRPVPGADTWKRRVRRCSTCNYEEDFFEIPRSDLEEYARVYETVVQFRRTVSQLSRNESKPPELSAQVREILGLSA